MYRLVFRLSRQLDLWVLLWISWGLMNERSEVEDLLWRAKKGEEEGKMGSTSFLWVGDYSRTRDLIVTHFRMAETSFRF